LPSSSVDVAEPAVPDETNVNVVALGTVATVHAAFIEVPADDVKPSKAITAPGTMP
jgi:hypothetical protein